MYTVYPSRYAGRDGWPTSAIPQDEALHGNDEDPSGWDGAKEGCTNESFEGCVLLVLYLQGMSGERHEIVVGIVGFDDPRVVQLLLVDWGKQGQAVGVEGLHTGGCVIAQGIEYSAYKISLEG